VSRVPRAPEKWRPPYRYATSLDAWAAYDAAHTKRSDEIESLVARATAEGIGPDALGAATAWFWAEKTPGHALDHTGGSPAPDCAACGPEPTGPVARYGALLASEPLARMSESEVPGTCLLCEKDVEWLYHWCFDASGSAFGVCRRCRKIYDGDLASEYIERKLREKTDGVPAEG
jgi:hypothetical protein